MSATLIVVNKKLVEMSRGITGCSCRTAELGSVRSTYFVAHNLPATLDPGDLGPFLGLGRNCTHGVHT